MIEFKIWEGDEYDNRGKSVYVNPHMVSSVTVTNMRRAWGGDNQVAIIKMADGERFIVDDSSRTVAKIIMDAQSIVQKTLVEDK